MPPRPQRNQHGGEGRWTEGIFALLLWQLIVSLLIECYMTVPCLVLGFCPSPGALKVEDGILISAIILNFLMLVLIWNEMILWTRDSLSVNRFLVTELGKMILILPFYVYAAVEFFRVSNKWDVLSWVFWSLIVIPGPCLFAVIIAIVAKYQMSRCAQVIDEERRPLLAGHDGPAPPETTTPGAALQEPAITTI